MSALQIKVAVVLLWALLAIMQYRLWFNDGILHVKALHLQVHAQHQENRQALQRNTLLAQEIESLKNHDTVIEEKARYDLGMIKPGETFYQFIEQTNGS